jgi:succinate dehydrogenase hydrophobic anchor subunit
MQNTISRPKAGEGYLLWFIKIVSGLLILLILLIHFLVNHYLAPQGLLTHSEVVAYYRNYPIVPIMEGFFLVFVVVHSLIGTRSIILDLNLKRGVMRVIDALLVVVGVVAISYGIWLLFAVLNWSV